MSYFSDGERAGGSFSGFEVVGDHFRATVTGGATISSLASTATIPGLLPDAQNVGTGIGSVANDKLSLIANSTELVRLDGLTNITSFAGKVNIGQGPGAPAGSTLVVVGPQGANTPGSGFATGQLQVRTTDTNENGAAVITGHNSFAGDTEVWYLGGTSGSNKDVAFINRQNGAFQIWTNNALGLTQTNDKEYIFNNADNDIRFGSDGMLTFNGTTHGIRLPNHTTTTRLALTHADGLCIYDVTLDALMLSINGVWKTISVT